MHTAESGTRMQFQWCGSTAAMRVDGRPVPLPRKAMALLAYLCIETGPHTRSHLSALLWPESDEIHAAMSLRQALTKLRELLGDALVADRQHVSLQRQDMPLAQICDVHRFESLLSCDPLAACRTDVHRFLDALDVDDAPAFVHWCDGTRARLRRSAVQGLRRAAQDCRVQRDWARLRDVSARTLVIDPLDVDAACDVIEASFLTRDVSGALAQRDLIVQNLAREELDDDATMTRLRVLVQKYAKLTQPTPSQGVRAVSPLSDMARADGHAAHEATAWHELALRERHEAFRRLVAAFEAAQQHDRTRWIALRGDVGAGRSRLLRDALAAMVARGGCVMSASARSGSTAYSAVSSLVRSVMHEDALAGVDERTLRTLAMLVPEIKEVYPALRRVPATMELSDATFAVQLQEALVQACAALTEDATLVVGLDDALDYDRESVAVLQGLAERTATMPVLWIATDADDEVQARSQGSWTRLVRGGEQVELCAIAETAVVAMLADASHVASGWEPLAARVHAAAHGMPGAIIEVLQQLEAQWGPPGDSWLRRPLDDVLVPALAPRLRGHVDALDGVARTMLLSLAVVMEAGHPLPRDEWMARAALTLDDLSHLHGISRLRAAVLGEHLVDCRLATEGSGGFRCASPMVVAYLLKSGSELVRCEVRRLVQVRLAGTNTV